MTQDKRPSITLALAGSATLLVNIWIVYDIIFNGYRPLHWKILIVTSIVAIGTYPNGVRLMRWTE